MRLDQMQRPKGSRKSPKRIGRGPGSGTGKTAARGHKGQGARSGAQVSPRFEGGQMPIARRLPKRGFKNPFRVAYQVVNLSDLARFEAGAEVDEAALRTAGLVRRRMPIKILGGGSLDRALVVRADAFSANARSAIEAAGGKAESAGRAATEATE